MAADQIPSCEGCGAGPDRQVGIVVRGVYDGVLYYVCIGCGDSNHRFPAGHRLRALAVDVWERADRNGGTPAARKAAEHVARASAAMANGGS